MIATQQPTHDTLAAGGRHVMALEKIAACHAGGLLIFATWAFGGNVRWAENVLMVLGNLGLLLTFVELRRRIAARQSLRPFLSFLPVFVFSLLAVVGTLRPNFDLLSIEGAKVFLPKPATLWLPSSARPDLSLRALMVFIALYVPAFNVSVAVRSRRVLIRLLLVLVANSVVLAVFGSLQKLAHASGLYFGAVASPNSRFFASFIYQNHWGAFALLMLSAGWGLILRATDFSRYRSFVQSPAFIGLVGLLLLAASVPLSASRSCTLLAGLLTAAAIGHGLRRILRHRKETGRTAGPILLAAVVLVIGASAVVYQLAWPVMQARVADTRGQVAHMRETGSLGGRADLYRDTWTMAADRLPFGWGMGTYPTVFMRYNRQVSIDRLPIYYEDAHSDWLQLLAETGLAGTLCMAAALLVPLFSLRRSLPIATAPHYILAGCALILIYALIEFPFGNRAVVLCFWLCFFSGIRLAQLDAREREV